MKYLIKLKKRHFKKLTKVLPKKRNQLHQKKLISKKVPKKQKKNLVNIFLLIVPTIQMNI